MRVSVSSVLEDEDPDQVDDQTGHRDRKQALVVDVWRLQGSLTGRQVQTDRQVSTDVRWPAGVKLLI